MSTHTQKDCPLAGQLVRFMRCGTEQTAMIVCWDVLTNARGQLVDGADLEDPRMFACAIPSGMAVVVCKSEVIA